MPAQHRNIWIIRSLLLDMSEIRRKWFNKDSIFVSEVLQRHLDRICWIMTTFKLTIHHRTSQPATLGCLGWYILSRGLEEGVQYNIDFDSAWLTFSCTNQFFFRRALQNLRINYSLVFLSLKYFGPKQNKY